MAVKGVMDISSVHNLASDTVPLNGEWEFYWNQLLTPDDFDRSEPPAISGYMSFPRAWNRYKLQDKAIGKSGYATFRLQILPPEGLTGELALRLRYLVSAYRLWVDGRLLAEGGVVGKDIASEIPNQHVHLPRLPIQGQSVELVLQISNFHWYQGGPYTSIELGNRERLITKQWLLWGVALLCCGAMLVMGIYHLVLFSFRPQNKSPLYFGMFCLLWMVLQLTSNLNDWCVNLLVGDIPIWFQNRFDVISLIISSSLAYTFFRNLYPEEFSYRIQQVSWFMSAIFIFLGFTLTTMAFSSAFTVFFIYMIFLILYTLIKVIKVFRRKHQEVLYILIGWIFMAVTSLNDVLYDMQVIQSVYMTHIGMALFIIFQSFALALLYSRSFSTVEHLSRELTDKNIALEQEIAQRTLLEREVVNVSEEERRRISQELHDGLCQLLTSARLHLSALRRKIFGSDAESSELDQLSSLLDISVNKAYELSRGLWPFEHASNGEVPSLGELARYLSDSSGISIQFQQQRACPKCSNTVMTQLFRIAQEAVTNAIKHAQPEQITIDLDCKKRSDVCLTVRDNGIGRSDESKNKGGLGLKIMAHRASIIGGVLTVDDGDKGGTVVTCVAPCEVHSNKETNP